MAALVERELAPDREEAAPAPAEDAPVPALFGGMPHTGLYVAALNALLWGVALLNYLDRQRLSTMRPSMAGDIEELRSATNFGYLMAIFLWIYGLMSPVSGVLADRFNRKWLIIASLFVWSAVTFAMGYATTFAQLYWLRAVMGVSEAISVAPSRINWWHPALVFWSIRPGTAKISRPCSPST